MQFYSTVGVILIDIIAIGSLILLLPGLLPDVTFSPYRLKIPSTSSGFLNSNDLLENVTKLFKNEVVGPESFATKDGYIYTGLIGGEIVRFTPDSSSYKVVCQVGQSCPYGSHCGRPLGLRFDRHGKLWVADANSGIYTIDVSKSAPVPKLVFSSKDPVLGKTPKIINSIDVDSSGIIYLTDSSTNGHLDNIMIEFLGDPSGRVLKYDPSTGRMEILVEELHFPNGIQLSEDESYVIIAETFRASLHKVFIRGPKKGSREIVIDNLPGFPDNVKMTDRGTFLVGILVPRGGGFTGAFDHLTSLPTLRKLALRTLYIIQCGLDTLHRLLPGQFTSYLPHGVLGSSLLRYFAGKIPGNVIEVNENGDIVRSFNAPSGRVNYISEAIIYENWMVLGSPYNNYIGVVQLYSPKVENGEQEDPSVSEVQGISSAV